MNDVVVGRVLRALRRRKGWRQLDLARRASVSQRHISSIERGHLDGASLRMIRRVFSALETRVEAVATWRGADLERLIDEDHARLVNETARRLETNGWIVRLEVTYSEFGERGSIDVLGLRPVERACLIVEVKATIGSAESTGRKLDEKARLAPAIVERREGWRPETVGRVLVVPEATSIRRLFTREPILSRMLPIDAVAVRTWLRRPLGPLAATWFLSGSTHGAPRRGSRVRLPKRMPESRSRNERDERGADHDRSVAARPAATHAPTSPASAERLAARAQDR
jgi:transcriptional regulator with XRE-family HTH domain